VYAAVPPATTEDIVALHALLQITPVAEIETVSKFGWVMVTVVVRVHPLPSVTVSVYAPAQRPLIDGVGKAPGCHK